MGAGRRLRRKSSSGCLAQSCLQGTPRAKFSCSPAVRAAASRAFRPLAGSASPGVQPSTRCTPQPAAHTGLVPQAFALAAPSAWMPYSQPFDLLSKGSCTPSHAGSWEERHCRCAPMWHLPTRPHSPLCPPLSPLPPHLLYCYYFSCHLLLGSLSVPPPRMLTSQGQRLCLFCPTVLSPLPRRVPGTLHVLHNIG